MDLDLSKTIKILLVKEDIKPIQLAEMIGTTKQNLSYKLRTGNFSVKDLNKIATVLGKELNIEFLDKDSNKKDSDN